MIVNMSFEYVFFPITIIIWGAYSLFNEYNKHYPMDNEYENGHTTYFYTSYSVENKNHTYKTAIKKLKHNFKISVDKNI